MKKYLMISGLALILAACSAKNTDPNWRPDMTNADFGKYPTNYAEIIQEWGEDHFDSNKAINYVSISSPREEYYVVDSSSKDVIYGYSVCANIGGVKSEGYYKPFKQYWFLIRNGKVVQERDLEYSYNRVLYKEHKVNCDDPH